MGRPQYSLLAPELLLHIMAYLPSGTLASAAVVCRAWKDPALDVLWRAIDLKNLLRVLAPVEEDDRELSFTRDLEPEDWARFHALAPRVRKAWLRSYLDSSLVDELQATNTKPAPLLPLVSDLEVCSLAAKGHGLIFVGPLLRSFDIRLRNNTLEEGETGAQLFHRIPGVMPMITKLKLSVERANADTVNSVSEMLKRLSLLTTIDLDVWEIQDTTAIGTALLGLPDLRYLRLTSDAPSIFGEANVVTTPFRSLRHLVVSTQSAPDLPGLLESIEPDTKLETLEYGNADGQVDGDITRLCQLAARCRRLGRLSLMGYIDPISLSYDVLAPLLPLSSLWALELQVGGPVVLTDDDIYHLASRLPELQILELYGDEGSTGMTLKAYETVTILCPNIRTLSLMVDATERVVQAAIPARRQLTSIYVQMSAIDNPQYVALFLARLSVAPDFKVTAASVGGEGQRKWKEVEDWVPALRKAMIYQETMIRSQVDIDSDLD